jgi:PKD domain
MRRSVLVILAVVVAPLWVGNADPVAAQEPLPPKPVDDDPAQIADLSVLADYDYYTLDSCRDEWGDGTGLKYRNRFASCMVEEGVYRHFECALPGCALTGVTRFRFTQIGFGSRTGQTMRFQAALDEWTSEGVPDLEDSFTIRFTCINFVLEGDVCQSTNPEPDTRTINQWMASGPIEVTLDTTGSVGGGDGAHRDADHVNYHQLKTFSWGEAPGIHEVTVPFRCDAATYLGSTGACLYQNVDSVHYVSILEQDGVFEEALHILLAQLVPEYTKPGVPGKEIPGSFESGAPLTRLYPGYDDNGQYDANHRVAVATCVEFWGADYVRGPSGSRDCDEYPYRSTFEGAYRSVLDPDGPWSYSARPIDLTQNRRAGGLLGTFYTSDHILHGDTFFVEVTGCDGCGGEPPPPPPPGNAPPSVDAGPDVTIAEGGSVQLAGSVTDPDDTPTVTWSYELGPDTDAGMSCQFTNGAQATSSIMCNDDGTVTVTLSADDGHGSPSPVSDSATVHVTNAAPELSLTAPQAWQLYRVDTLVSVGGTFTDPGTNDTHTCSVDWDDGQPPASAPGSNHLCGVERTFTDAGMYTLQVSVTDDDGGVDTAEVMVVVYDPTAGVAAGNGALQSPAGALSTRPDASGLVRFLFGSKYQSEDSTVPIGTSLDFDFQRTFRFHSEELEWLVITRDAKVAIKGTGTLDRQSDYGFVLYGEAGKFRLVLWPLSHGPFPTGQPLYDNSRNASYDVDEAQPKPITFGTVIVTDWYPGRTS